MHGTVKVRHLTPAQRAFRCEMHVTGLQMRDEEPLFPEKDRAEQPGPREVHIPQALSPTESIFVFLRFL